MSSRWLLPVLVVALAGVASALMDRQITCRTRCVRFRPRASCWRAPIAPSSPSGVDVLGKEIDALESSLKEWPSLVALLPDVQIYHNAVRYGAHLRRVLQRQGSRCGEGFCSSRAWSEPSSCARARRHGTRPPGWWCVATSRRSTARSSLMVWWCRHRTESNTPHRFRLDVWCHGRGETLSEVNFINGRQSSPGEFMPPNAFVLHPYGRYCNANKFAGEIDLFEAIEDVKKHYPIDDNRLVMRGFSMGGAACWQFAVHYPSTWVAAAPGAGFSETPDFLKVFQNETVQPIWYEKKLWHLYDCTDYALNLFNCPTVAYSGENDRQKQAADMMAKALKEEGIELVHIIGAKAGHHYTPEAKAEINRRIDAIADAGRDPVPQKVLLHHLDAAV